MQHRYVIYEYEQWQEDDLTVKTESEFVYGCDSIDAAKQYVGENRKRLNVGRCFRVFVTVPEQEMRELHNWR